MAVEVKYVVIREGEEKMSFTSKKEADAWDKMLDTADLLDTWLEQSPVVLGRWTARGVVAVAGGT
ncbi:DNA damage-inducible gene in SOS regulon-dependent on cyclic AMP and H-NS [Salmonella enterica subsp. enterica]|uniref:DNA damage-inducible gene in SOS regulon-dependent on cyclic AMP and H-NS n=1 Tax=Salmonella enterica I TaxID=59201 RepID=A0A3S4GG91_SALET|nr:DNA damage-inducible gene in SOS regulon-dependent on cyclic AMP and H-NS [Salmonella enterica subsp. enterica]